VRIPTGWPSGCYEVAAITADDKIPQTISLAFFVVRTKTPASRILLVLPTATYGAYNDYGGASLYVKWKDIIKGGTLGGEPRVSFLRPWMPGFLWKPEDYSFDRELSDRRNLNAVRINKRSGLAIYSTSAGFHNWDRKLVLWLESNGYKVDYAISSDLDHRPQLVDGYRLMISVGHDEYWSWRMRDSVETFISRGGNACFFSGNLIWQVRFEDDGNTMLCYKDAPEQDPKFGTPESRLVSTLWSSPIVGRSESEMTGVSFHHGGYAGWSGVTPQGADGYLVYRPGHWIFRGSGLTYGDRLGHESKIVHFEVDGCPIEMRAGLPVPGENYRGPPSFEILGMAPATLPPVDQTSPQSRQNYAALKKLLEGTPEFEARNRLTNHAVMGIYTSGGTVFSAGTTDWTNGLTGRDPAVEQVTRNIIDRLQAA
jgi:hypothetical protein